MGPAHDDPIRRWIRDLALTHAHSTRERYAKILRHLEAHLPEGVAVVDATDRHLRGYLADRVEAGISARTQRQTLAAYRAFARWAMREGLRPDDPTITIAWPKLPKTRQRPLSAAQLRQLARLLISDPPCRRGVSAWQYRRNCRAILIMLYAALRLSEVGALTWDQVDLDGLLLYVEHGKGDKDRVVPIHPVLAYALTQVPAAERRGPVIPARQGTAMGPRSLAHICQRWLPSIGLDDVAAHALRRTCATLMRREGADLEVVRDTLGHESLATTQIYLGPDPELLRRGVEALPSLDELLSAAPEIRALPKRRKG